MNNQVKGLIYGALLGDAFALGAHWLYDPKVIKRHFCDIVDFSNPLAPYHKGKVAGDYTHYGDQACHLIDYISSQKDFKVEEYRDLWLKWIVDADIYMDHATKDSMLLLKDGMIGAKNNELGGLVRGVGLFRLDTLDKETLKAYIHLTHNDVLLDRISDFTYDWIMSVLNGKALIKSLKNLLNTTYKDLMLHIPFDLEDINDDVTDAVLELGQACACTQSFPASLYIILKHQDDVISALKANVMAGGDSAARGIYIGMMIGAKMGYKALPEAWLSRLNRQP